MTQAEKNAKACEWRRRMVDEGRCTKCGGPSDGHSYCPECRAFRRDVYRMDREMGLCYVCEKEAARPGMGYCFKCAVKISKRYYDHRKKEAK